ncbi:MAG TPA: serine/threonine-protein kinase, partial [Kofleriaceae bacterium]|nr:serine/threonine-protein kinase [Kofleriaceae bacterium]
MQPAPLNQKFGRYELLTMLARGGMAEVFLARMSGVGGFAKLLVIKRILPHLNDDPEFHEMFLNEGRVTARLNHSNICQVYELGEVDGVVFLAMEYLEGLPWSDLAPLLPRGRGVELRVAATVLGQICEGLRFAHEYADVDGKPMPIVHRDVSPQNLFITNEGVCKLLDFGVSKVLTEGTRTRTGMLKGKLPYMAPEQIRGEPIDARADVFSMGVVLWEALTGARLFNRDSDYQIWKAITEEEVPRVTSRVPGLPVTIDGVVMRALERDVNRRYPSIRAFAGELREVAERAGGTFDTATLSQILKSLGAGKLADKNEKVSRAIGRPARASEPPPVPAAITQPLPTIEPSVTQHSIALRDASVKLGRRKPRLRIAIAVGVLAIVVGITAALWTRKDPAVADAQRDAAAVVAVATGDAEQQGSATDDVEIDEPPADDPDHNEPDKPVADEPDKPARPRPVRRPKKVVEHKPPVDA